MCLCWTIEHNRVAMVVRGEPLLHKRDCPEREEGQWAVEDVYEETETPSPIIRPSTCL